MKKEKILIIVAKILFVGIFLTSGFNKIFNFANTQKYMESAGMPVTALFLVGAIILLLAGSASILLNIKPKTGAYLLMIFLIPATLIFHNNLSDQIQMIMFMKNVSILGGLLLYSVYADKLTTKK